MCGRERKYFAAADLSTFPFQLMESRVEIVANTCHNNDAVLGLSNNNSRTTSPRNGTKQQQQGRRRRRGRKMKRITMSERNLCVCVWTSLCIYFWKQFVCGGHNNDDDDNGCWCVGAKTGQRHVDIFSPTALLHTVSLSICCFCCYLL